VAFPQEKATYQCTQKVYVYAENALEDDINQPLATREAIAACVFAEVAEADQH
jgi:hypothetical protein